MRITIAALSAVLLAGTTVAADAQGNGKQGKDKDTVTISGCLSVNAAARTYILTAKPDDMAKTARDVTGGPTTLIYQLVGGEGLQKHVGDRVEVTGRIEPDSGTKARSESERSGPPRNAPQSGDKPKVETKAETSIRANVLRVERFRFIESNCKPTEG